MKVGRWKVLGLAGVLVLGYVATSDAAQIKVSDETWANFGLNMKIWYKNLDKRSNATNKGGWSQNVFSVGNAKIYFTGQVNKIFQFYGEFDQEKSPALGEAGINLAFAKEFQVLAGLIRKPFTKAQINSGYAYLTPQGYWLDPQDPKVIQTITDQLKSTDGGLVFHGDLAGGILNYRIGVFNENREYSNKLWVGYANSTEVKRWTDSSPTSGAKANNLKNFEWAARVEFQPLMLGFKPDSAATITGKSADTWLGAKDVFIIGLGFNKEAHTPKSDLKSSGNKTLTRTGWTIDATLEKKFGNVVPNLQIGYIKLDDTHFYYKYGPTNSTHTGNVATKKGDTDIWYIQGQLLYDQVVGLGKPALAFRYEKIEGDGEYLNGNGTIQTSNALIKKGLDVSTYGLALNYYIKGQAARISLGFDVTKYDGALSAILKRAGITNPNLKEKDRITDWYLYLQSQF